MIPMNNINTLYQYHGFQIMRANIYGEFEPIYFSKAMAAQISRQKKPHTSLHIYAKNVPEATRKKIYMASNGQ